MPYLPTIRVQPAKLGAILRGRVDIAPARGAWFRLVACLLGRCRALGFLGFLRRFIRRAQLGLLRILGACGLWRNQGRWRGKPRSDNFLGLIFATTGLTVNR